MSKLKISKKSERSVFNNLFSEVSGGWCLPLLLVGLLSLESISLPSHVGDVSLAKLNPPSRCQPWACSGVLKIKLSRDTVHNLSGTTCNF
jgi:hypothetical protein